MRLILDIYDISMYNMQSVSPITTAAMFVTLDANLQWQLTMEYSCQNFSLDGLG